MDTHSTQVERFAALGHPVRLAILRQIVQGASAGTPAGEIQQALGIPASTLSHHLSTLSAARLVAVARQGTSLHYRADFDTLRALTVFLWEDCCRRDGQDGVTAACCAPELPACALEPPVVAAPTRPAAWSPDFD